MASRKSVDGKIAAIALFVPDTNFFLQCRSSEEVEWNTVTEAVEVRLLVVRTVQREIDELKGGGNARRAKRARKASALFRKALQSSDGTAVVRESAPRVILELGPRLPPDRKRPFNLDPDVNDDCIVEEIMATAEQLGKRINLLTGDAGPMHTAHAMGVAYTEIPEEWMLPPEQDSTARRLTQLEQQLEQLNARNPQITVEARQEGKTVSTIKGTVDTPAAVLAGDFIEQMQRLVAAKHPKRLGPDRTNGVTIFREADWQKYWVSYDDWLETLGPHMERLVKWYTATVIPVGFDIYLNNEGGATAIHPRVEVITKGPIRLVSASARKAICEFDGCVFPEPPSPPTQQPKPNRKLARLNDIPMNFFYRAPSEAVLGKNFHWIFDDPAIASCRSVGECLELRHGLDGEIFNFQVIPEPGCTGQSLGSVTVRVSAPNLPEPFNITFRVEIDRRDHSVESRILATLAEEFGLHRRSLKDLGIISGPP